MTHKYNAEAVRFDGHRFASKAEARRYAELRLLERAGKISELQLQPVFVLQAGFRHALTGRQIRPIRYVGDFAYHEDGQLVVEDVKGYEPLVWKIKQKLFLKLYPEVDLRVVR